MKRITIIDVAIVLAIAGFFAPAQAKGSSHPQAGEQRGVAMVPIETAQRAITFSSNRHWHDTEGNILICAFDAKSNSSMECEDKKTGANRWVPLSSHKIPGHEIAGFQYSFVGSYGSQVLVVYYRAIKPAAVMNDADADAVKRSQNLSGMSATVGTITIKADKVIVRRGK